MTPFDLVFQKKTIAVITAMQPTARAPSRTPLLLGDAQPRDFPGALAFEIMPGDAFYEDI